MWSHVVLHATTLLRFRPTLLNTQTSLEVVSGRIPNIRHLRVFGCQVWIAALEPQIRTISAHRLKGVYVGFDSPSIIRYLEIRTGVVHKSRFENCRFIETVFLKLPHHDQSPPLAFRATESFTMNPDPRTVLAETDVKKLLHLQTLANQISDSFDSGTRISRSPVPGFGNPKIPLVQDTTNIHIQAQSQTGQEPQNSRAKIRHHQTNTRFSLSQHKAKVY